MLLYFFEGGNATGSDVFQSLVKIGIKNDLLKKLVY